MRTTGKFSIPASAAPGKSAKIVLSQRGITADNSQHRRNAGPSNASVLLIILLTVLRNVLHKQPFRTIGNASLKINRENFSMSMADRDGQIWHDGKLVPWRDATTHV
ncbi:MAG: hypothetical protein ACTS5G_00210, partial [Burkholderiales bacterium]